MAGLLFRLTMDGVRHSRTGKTQQIFPLTFQIARLA
jgi:hypothetical protein